MKSLSTYDRSGKFNKHYARPSFTYTFNEKAKINGKTYYKIAGTNNWIPAKKLVLKK
ncbi:SLAP domain-containing protein [Lactobacillus crispatus]|uniref:SLAP domain-containing protein n=1 Tax=Lactobacillus crispatus TaxID=47770 RepID=UPI0015DA3DA2|nr:SLAP domain-containing protein [Lactobacillus crispatus]